MGSSGVDIILACMGGAFPSSEKEKEKKNLTCMSSLDGESWGVSAKVARYHIE